MNTKHPFDEEVLKKKFDMGVSLLCWGYNEEESILEYLERISTLLDECIEDYEIILIDDCSTDRTNEIVSEFQKKNPKLKIFRNEINLNVGISCRRAIQRATKEYLFWQTIDWSYDISNLRIFLEYLKYYDMVQGVRREAVKEKYFKPFFGLFKLLDIEHLFKRSDNIQKAIVSIGNYIVVRTLFQVPVSDYQNITFYPTKWIQSVEFEARSSFVNPEMIIKSYWNGMSIKEVPIKFIPRKEGEAKGTKPAAIMNSIKDILRLWFNWIILGKRGKVKYGKVDRLVSGEW